MNYSNISSYRNKLEALKPKNYRLIYKPCKTKKRKIVRKNGKKIQLRNFELEFHVKC